MLSAELLKRGGILLGAELMKKIFADPTEPF